MEGDQRKQQRYTKRRERVHNKLDPDGGKDEMDSSPSRSDGDKPRAKPPRRRRNRSHSHDEDIIDGFAILSFKSLEDLNNLMKPYKAIELKNQKNDFVKRKKKKPRIKPCRPLSPTLNHRFSDNSSIHSVYSDRTEEFSDQRSGSRDGGLSDVSTHSSSGRGYLCDSESGDERASNASSDLFSTLNHNRECPAPSTTSCSSPCSTPITSTVSSQTDSGITTATVSTTSAVSAYTTATETNPTASTTTTTSCTIVTKTTNSSVIANGPLTTSKEKPASPILSKSGDSRSPHLKKPFPRPSSETLLHKDQRKFSPSPIRTPRREDQRSDKDFPLPPSFGFSKNWHSGSNPHLHSPYNQVSHSPGLPQFGLHSTSHGSSFSSLPPSPLHNLIPTAGGPQSMFAAPLPPGAANGSLTSPHSLGGANLSTHASPESMSLASQEILREELNRRFLAAQEPAGLPVLGSTPYVRADIHQHQHMHQHQHQHTHQHMFALPGLTGSLVPSPAPHLYDKVPKPFESPFYRTTPSGLLGYPMVPPLIHSGNSLNSGSSGAFQPKKVASGLLHPSQMIPGLREPDKVPPSAASLPHHKKSGKWCSMHVQIAWKIHRHQQESPDVSKGGEGKSLDPLQSGRNLSSSNLHRPTDLSMSSSLLGMSSFPRPSPYPFTSHEGFGGLGKGGSPFGNPGREMPKIPGIASPQEWSRLHTSRSSPLFSGSHWSKPDEREREIEKEREKEREVVLGLDRRREERERERRSSDRERRGSVDLDQSKDRPFMGADLRHPHTVSHSRSRSRSPLVGGRVGSAKSDTSYNRDEKDIIKVKEEKPDKPETSAMEREREKFRPEYLLGASNLMDRSRLLGGPSPFPFGADRLPPPPQSLWGPHQEKSLMDFSYHSLQIQREMEQERERMLRRLQPQSMGLYDHDRVRKDEILMQEERLRREYFDRIPQFERERFEREKLALESSRLGHSRHFDPLRPSGHFPRTISPLVNHSGMKVGSPALLQGPPPPLIPSSSTPTTRSHSNSPAMTKLKPPSSSDIDKRDSYSSSNLDGHGR